MCDNTLGGITASTGLGYGMLFASYCDGLIVHSNTMNQSYYGLTLQSSGFAHILGDQGGPLESQENTFNGTFSGGYRNSTFLNLTMDSLHLYPVPNFYYNSTAPLTNPEPSYAWANSSSYPLAEIRGLATSGSSGFSYECADYRPYPFPYPFPIHKVGLMDSIIALNNSKYYMEPGFDTTGPWLASKILYESLYNADSILITDSLMNAYVTNMNSTGYWSYFAK